MRNKHLFFKSTNPGISFFLTENDSAFDILYCITFKLMDHEWLAMRASYMDFNVCSSELEFSLKLSNLFFAC